MIVSYFFVFLFLGLIAYVAYFQTVESSEYLKGQYSQYDKRQEKMAGTGNPGALFWLPMEACWLRHRWTRKEMRPEFIPMTGFSPTP